jgi:LuxR family maltose regulon positive regulatory protein
MDAGTLRFLSERYPLLITKLYIPRLDTELLRRPYLMERLSQAAAQPLVVISAPAGWGKTTLVASWVRQAGYRFGWISLDEGDNDLARFWLHLIAALQQIRPGVGEVALSWFYTQGTPPGAPPVEARLAMLINDLAWADETFLLVLDDYHCIRSQVVHDSLTFLIENLPPNVHLILTSRSDLPWPRARWRAGRQLVEFDSRDLRFSLGECTEFLHKAIGLNLTPDQIAALVDRTEGWVAGLQLVALALQATSSQQGQLDVGDFIADLSASSRYIFNYLSEEVLGRQEPEIQEFLFNTSVLERLSGELCEAVTGVRESQHILEKLEQSKLFIVSLNEERRWFRYHHLLREFLSSQLAHTRPDVVADLHRRAAQWYAANGLPHDAVPHAMAAQDYELAGHIIMEYGNDLWRREEYTTLRNWLDALPLSLRESHPDLCLLHAWSLFRTLRLDEMMSLLTRAETLLDEGAPPLVNFSTGELRGILATIQAAISALRQDLNATSEFARSALAQLPPEQHDWRYAALVGAGLAHHYHNDTYAAMHAFEEAFKAAVALERGTGSFYGRAFAISWLARLYMVQGYLQRAKAIYQEALPLATGQTGKLLPTAAWALTGLGELYYQWNDLELAEKYFNDSLALSTQITPSTAPPYLPVARLAQARGDVRSAEAFLAQAVRLAARVGVPSFDRQVSLCQAWLALRQGNLAALENWIGEHGLDLAQPIPPREEAYVMAARILIARHDYPAALALVEKLLAIADAGGRGGVVIELLILQSLTLQGQDKPDSALAVLQRAIALASQEGYVRIFVDEGEPMLQLLRLFVARFGATDYAARLLSAFATKAETPDVLNERELEILRLLATGMSNKEIGEALFITVGTVKWHANHIYAKLEVKNRGEAVAKARELHLISNSTS